MIYARKINKMPKFYMPRPRVWDQDQEQDRRLWDQDHILALRDKTLILCPVSRPRPRSRLQDRGLKSKVMVSRPRPWSRDHDHGRETKAMVSRPWPSRVQDHGHETKAMVWDQGHGLETMTMVLVWSWSQDHILANFLPLAVDHSPILPRAVSSQRITFCCRYSIFEFFKGSKCLQLQLHHSWWCTCW